MAKLGNNLCKKCYIKPLKSDRSISKKDNGRKIYYYKFQNSDTKSRLLLNSTEQNIGYSICIEPTNLSTTRSQPIENNALLFLHTWDQFRSLNEFTSCIIRSDHISFPYFILSCNTVIQNHPNFQQFIHNRQIDLPSSKVISNLILPYPLTNSMQLICQESFWDGLISTYFKEFHPMCPLLSLRSFDRKKASSSLLTAMYVCAYHFSKQQSDTVSEYMEKLEAQNIKKIVKMPTIDNLRAIIIHIFMIEVAGKWILAKSLQASLTRMSYSLGLHLDCSKLSPIDRYNRKLLFNSVRSVNIGLSGSHNFSPNYLTEFGKDELNLYDPKWQLPGPNSPIYFENQLENHLYSICISKFSKFANSLVRGGYIPSFYNLEANTFKKIWNSKISKLKVIFDSILQEFEELKENFSEFREKVEPYQTLAEMQYHDAVIDMHEMLKHKNKSLKSSEVSSILAHCHDLYLVVATKADYSPHYAFYAHVIGLNYLNMYHRCSESEKVITRQRLKDLILFIKDKFFSYFSLNYLILKTGYDSIVDH
ncbi:hypothetical protein CONCODRAFT_78990 [Conidiobolus coronatus NRRL 28638]|uniref:Xylanolytic transcriptional activator regulatory domain-containing protein n=1 Tax=Conidiobolus coronatus (strain ATCC 28846 / CBS 209.66 / NRRL 28638) TaxID=796925 RepID=A0A137P577_CONC2|nr:hypothetical protein CONCODRAFT_78990 [Conidiobolus coronatus NRRL 28638]|eukprot:KXN70170.1 hypothetical protein CONCODRAFT_78990 [Conidiobolus coronatus NRRL 28638]